MIVKKPYAFLIKNFRIIHGILFCLLLFISAQTLDIYSFFNDYASNQAFNRINNLTSIYIDYFTFMAVIVSAVVTLLIAGILKLKNKSISSYVFIFSDIIVNFIYFIYMFSIFQDLETYNLSIESVRVIRDISLIILLVQIIIIFVVLSRTLGFNIKQFDFKKDLEELNITESDSEEVEVIIGNNNYKYARFFRKLLRLSKYFILENKLFVIVCASFLALSLSLALFMRINVYAVNYNENQQIIANSLRYTVNKSYITQTDMSSKIITKNKKYIIVETTISNIFSVDYSLTRDTFRLIVDDEMIFPTFTLSSKFIDLGTPFDPSIIKSGEDKTVIVIFEIDKSLENTDYIFRIKNYDESSFGNIESRYKDIIIKPQNLDNSKNEGTYTLSADLNFKNTVLKDTSMLISSFEIGDKFKEDYEYCIEENCKNGTFVVTPSLSGKGNISIMKINATLNFDETLYMKRFIQYPADLLEYYGYIKYTAQGYVETVNINKIDVKYNKDKIAYIEVPASIKNATQIDLIINVRGIKYTIDLK